MRCPWCGVENKPGAKTCAECGVILLFDGGPSGTNAPPPSPKPVIEKAPRRRKEEAYDPYRERRQTALILGSIIAGVIIVMLVLTFVRFPALSTGGETQTVQPLAGTWETTQPALFLIKTNWPTGNMTDIGYENRTMTFVITGTDDPSIVYVDVTYSVVYSSIGQDAMYGPEPSPQRYEGKVNGSMLLVEQGGLNAEFYFNGVTLAGYWNDTLAYSYFTENVSSGQDGISMDLQGPVIDRRSLSTSVF
jgi:hypothetical protein